MRGVLDDFRGRWLLLLAGIVQGDIKPANILFADGRASRRSHSCTNGFVSLE
jgi:prepilin-type processing-associated H-X9-DG protein